jgi:NAD(P)-dependent dehydrogenase (short-subunit alcohol dehydrogenase family)
LKQIDFSGETHKMNPMNTNFDLSGKTIVVTGASSGIGWRAALEFCRCGASVIGVGRDTERCVEARQKILTACPDAKIRYLLADLSRQSEVRWLADEIRLVLKETSCRLDVLVNNAGTFVDTLTLTEDGIEKTIAVNHLAPFLLTYLLLPELKANPESRVLTVSSGSHYRTYINPARLRKPLVYNCLWAYKVSKLCNVLFSLELNEQTGWKAPIAFAIDPGLVNTEIGLKGTGSLVSLVWQMRQKSGVDVSVPAATILHAAANPEAANSKEVYWYLSAPRKASRNALNKKLAHALWLESCRLCHIDV